MLGYELPEEMIATITDIGRQVYVELPRRAEFMQLMAEPGSVSGFEFQMHRKDGGTIWVSENARAIRDANDTLLYYEGTTEDITERKRAEEALRESEHKVSEALEFNRKILNTSSIGILTYKESGQCVSANAAAAKVTGGTLAAAFGTKLSRNSVLEEIRDVSGSH